MNKKILLFLLMLMPMLGMGQTLLYENDFTGITAFYGWTQFDDSQTDGKVEVDPDGVAITVGIQTGQLWQPQVMVVPDGSFNLKEGSKYTVVVTAKFPTSGTLQINMGTWSANDQDQFPVTATGDFQEVVCEFPDWSVDANGAHLLFMCGDFKGTTILKNIEIWNGDPSQNGKIYYNFIEKGKIAEVIQNPNNKYKGNIIIPEKVTHDGVEYTVTKIADNAFQDCSGLTSITIPNSITSIGYCAFGGCSGLTSITIPNSVNSISGSAFEGCSGLTSITIPSGVTNIRYSTFASCSNLTSVTIPKSLNSIMEDAFAKCYNLKAVYISDLEAWLNVYLDEGTIVSDNPISSSPLYYANHLFLNGKEITELEIPNTISTINNFIFCNWSSLTSVSIPNSVTSINYFAFKGCKGLTSITIPNSVTSIGWGAFQGCTGLTTIVSEIDNPFEIDDDVFYCSDVDIYSTATLIVPPGKKSAYQNTAGWNKFKNIIEAEEEGTSVSTKLSDGFYYFKNAATGRYISFNDTNPENYLISASGDVNMAGIRTYINYDTVSVSPSCVIFVKNLGNNQYDLTFQDSNLKGLLSNISDIKITYVDNEKYTIHIIYNGITKYLCDGSSSEKDSWLMNRLEETRYWIPIPINTTDNYIGVRPDVKTASGEFWGTIYTGFNFKVASEGMAAYYVSDAEGAEFNLERINEEVIPAGTPVVIRCNSSNPKDNKIEPVLGDYSFSGNNKLGGVYCALSGVAQHFNATEYAPITMRVIGLNDTGELSFVKANPENLYNDIYLRANKAYLKVNSTDAEVLSLMTNKKCAKPTISYNNGKISFSCETEGVEFHYTISNTNSSTGIGSSVNFSPTVNISVYASKSGFGNSDTSTAEIVVTSGLRGDLTGDGKVNVADHVELSKIILDQ